MIQPDRSRIIFIGNCGIAMLLELILLVKLNQWGGNGITTQLQM